MCSAGAFPLVTADRDAGSNPSVTQAAKVSPLIFKDSPVTNTMSCLGGSPWEEGRLDIFSANIFKKSCKVEWGAAREEPRASVCEHPHLDDVLETRRCWGGCRDCDGSTIRMRRLDNEDKACPDLSSTWSWGDRRSRTAIQKEPHSAACFLRRHPDSRRCLGQ